jgi:hypothetical protein
MGPPDAAEPALWVVTKAGVTGEAVGVDVELPEPRTPVAGGRGRVSNERVLRQEARTIEKVEGVTGS